MGVGWSGSSRKQRDRLFQSVRRHQYEECKCNIRTYRMESSCGAMWGMSDRQCGSGAVRNGQLTFGRPDVGGSIWLCEECSSAVKWGCDVWKIPPLAIIITAPLAICVFTGRFHAHHVCIQVGKACGGQCVVGPWSKS